MSIQLIAFDMDGTLLTDQRKPDPRTVKMIHEAMKQGIHFAIASGRDQQGLLGVDQILKLDQGDHYLILMNGQSLYTFASRQLEKGDPLSSQDAIRILNAVEKYDTEGIFCFEDRFYSVLSPEMREKRKLERIRKTGTADYGLETIQRNPRYSEAAPNMPLDLSGRLNKVCICDDPSFFEDHLEDLKRDLPDYQLLMVGPGWMEVMPKGVSKGRAVKKLAERLNIDLQDVMAFGDAQNDLDMIEAAGISAAMGNAIECVKEAATLVTADNNHNGIGIVLQDLLDGKEADLRKGIVSSLN